MSQSVSFLGMRFSPQARETQFWGFSECPWFPYSGEGGDATQCNSGEEGDAIRFWLILSSVHQGISFFPQHFFWKKACVPPGYFSRPALDIFITARAGSFVWHLNCVPCVISARVNYDSVPRWSEWAHQKRFYMKPPRYCRSPSLRCGIL